MDVIKVFVEVLIFVSVIGVIATSVVNSQTRNITGGTARVPITGANSILIGLFTLLIVVGFIVYLTRRSKMK